MRGAERQLAIKATAFKMVEAHRSLSCMCRTRHPRLRVVCRSRGVVQVWEIRDFKLQTRERLQLAEIGYSRSKNAECSVRKTRQTAPIAQTRRHIFAVHFSGVLTE